MDAHQDPINVHARRHAALDADLRAAALRVSNARHWPDFTAAAFAGFELATRTARALVDASPFEDHIRLAEVERAATDGRDILRSAPGRMNAAGPLGPPIALACGHVASIEACLSGLADRLFARFALAIDEPLNADELVAFSEAMDAADRLQHALDPDGVTRQDASGRAMVRTDSTGTAREVDDDDLP